LRRTAGYILVYDKRNEEILEELKVEPADEKPTKCKLATTGHKNGQQQDARNNAELQNKWKKTTSKGFEKTTIGG